MAKRKLVWIRQWGPPDVVVWINVSKVNESWKRERGYYVAPGARSKTASPKRYEGVRKWVASGRRIWMPHIGLYENGDVSFTDGRHRFAWMRDHCVKFLPVSTSSYDAKEVAKRYGTSSRSSTLALRLSEFAP